MLKGIDNYQINDMNAYNRIRVDQGRDAELKKLGTNDAALEQKQQEVRESDDMDLRLGEIRPRKNASLEDISLSLNEPKAFEMKGKDSDLSSLDIEKAVSDMQKDQALMQYQYFVGESNIVNNEDGIVIAK